MNKGVDFAGVEMRVAAFFAQRNPGAEVWGPYSEVTRCDGCGDIRPIECVEDGLCGTCDTQAYLDKTYLTTEWPERSPTGRARRR